MSDEQVEKIELPLGLTAEEIGVALRNRYDEMIAADVADLLVQGFTIDQIHIDPPSFQVFGKTLRVTTHMVGRRIETID